MKKKLAILFCILSPIVAFGFEQVADIGEMKSVSSVDLDKDKVYFAYDGATELPSIAVVSKNSGETKTLYSDADLKSVQFIKVVHEHLYFLGTVAPLSEGRLYKLSLSTLRAEVVASFSEFPTHMAYDKNKKQFFIGLYNFDSGQGRIEKVQDDGVHTKLKEFSDRLQGLAFRNDRVYYTLSSGIYLVKLSDQNIEEQNVLEYSNAGSIAIHINKLYFLGNGHLISVALEGETLPSKVYPTSIYSGSIGTDDNGIFWTGPDLSSSELSSLCYYRVETQKVNCVSKTFIEFSNPRSDNEHLYWSTGGYLWGSSIERTRLP